MTTRPYSLRASQAVSALLFATACGLTACAPDDDANGNPYQPLPDAGFTQDASAIVVADAGTQTQLPPVTTPDSGTIKPLDSGVPVVTTDTGVPVVTGDAGAVVTGDAGAVPDAGPARADQGMGDGKDVITIGDSWMNLMAGVGIENSLERVSKRDYRNFGVSGTKLLDEVIPKSYTTAKAAGPVKTVIMTGGGNDIIQDKLTACSDDAFGDECKTQIDKVGARLVKLWAEMAADGVMDVVVVGYTKKANIFGLFPVSKSEMYSEEKIPPLCAAVPAPLRCHAIDTDKEVPSLMLRSDGIHPNDAGYDAIAKVVWDLMQAQGMRR